MVRSMRKSVLSMSLALCILIITPTMNSTIYAAEATFTQVAAGSGFSMALQSDGTLWGWSTNIHVDLGIEDNSFHPEPIKIMEGVKSVFVEDSYTMVIKNDNSLWSWGHSPCLGGNERGRSRPEPLKIMNDVKSVYLARSQAMAIKTDNSLWGWGNRGLGVNVNE